MNAPHELVAAFVAMMAGMAILFITVIASVVIYERVKFNKKQKERNDG